MTESAANSFEAVKSNLMKLYFRTAIIVFFTVDIGKIIQYFLVVLMVCAFYSEWFVYELASLSWPKLECDPDEMCTRILFIANPQLPGETAVPKPFRDIINFDSDQYLETSFAVAANHFMPDVLVYVGNIMDEGSTATTERYKRYVRRLDIIFRTYYPVVEIWTPGETDIGNGTDGETKKRLDTFNDEFQDSQAATLKNISFYEVNGLTNTFPKLEDNSSDLYKIVISKYPVTLKTNLSMEIIKEIDPKIFFCSHSHESKYVRHSKDMSSNETFWLPGNERACLNGSKDIFQSNIPWKEVLIISPDNQFRHEIYLPTCSYGVGTNRMGYGAAVFEHKNRTLRYAVLWSPQRYLYLYIYLCLFIFIMAYAVGYWANKWHTRRGKELVPQKTVGSEPIRPVAIGEGDCLPLSRPASDCLA